MCVERDGEGARKGRSFLCVFSHFPLFPGFIRLHVAVFENCHAFRRETYMHMYFLFPQIFIIKMTSVDAEQPNLQVKLIFSNNMHSINVCQMNEPSKVSEGYIYRSKILNISTPCKFSNFREWIKSATIGQITSEFLWESTTGCQYGCVILSPKPHF